MSTISTVSFLVFDVVLQRDIEKRLLEENKAEILRLNEQLDEKKKLVFMLESRVSLSAQLCLDIVISADRLSCRKAIVH